MRSEGSWTALGAVNVVVVATAVILGGHLFFCTFPDIDRKIPKETKCKKDSNACC
jgi:hypothetical protein